MSPATQIKRYALLRRGRPSADERLMFETDSLERVFNAFEKAYLGMRQGTLRIVERSGNELLVLKFVSEPMVRTRW